ncbi:MAG: hypothetical protein CVU06_10240 [Bacteroidetes bacterium HGW-Bacteroidetes-22]|nr:MAG: hypothetical protein CVU06_10240 [Bacteroidetes bacterium HGW-Bacteroidetes-22]
METKMLISRKGVAYQVEGITVPEVLDLLREPVNFIDVREPKDYSLAAVDHPALQNTPILTLLEKLESFDRDQKYLIVDMDGTLAWKAANMLLYNDFRDVHFIAGGMIQWKNSGQPIKGRLADLLSDCNDGSSCGGCSCGCND